MNQGIYKLVYSKVLNMVVPTSEAVPSQGAKSGRRVRRHTNNLFKCTIAFILIYSDGAFADTVTAIDLQKSVNATISSAVNSTIIHQTAPKAILDWNKLNIAKDYLLKFDQQGNRTWSALNRITDLNPSVLNGIVQADGNVYFINANGIIIGKDAQFNVGSLYAGTLDITDDLFKAGFVNESSFTKAFELVGSLDTNIQAVHENAKVVVESGAQISTLTNGKVLLFAPTVENSGIINTPDGQTILAAGKKVYLQSSKDPAGFLVEVDGGGSAVNLGKIVAERGNITMMGLAVNQAGTLTATTSVRANGSIRLLAQDKAIVDMNGSAASVRNGLVTIAKNSVTEVNPEYADKEETIASQAFATSNVTVEASLVNIDGKISAKGGNVTVSALNPASADLNSQNQSRIYLGNNAVIDVSGVDAVAPMSRNQLEIQLFSDQLKDAPILRDGGLFKETVYVDARKGTQLFDIQPFVALKGATVAEKMTKAGSITLSTPNEIIAENGSVLNVSGGSTTYEAGSIKETNLFYNGKLVPISEAKPGVPYDKTADIYAVKDAKWGVTRSWDLSGSGTEGWGRGTTGITNSQLKTTIVGSQVAGYFEGDDAGVLDLTVHDDKVVTQNLAMTGQLLANTKVSTQQLINQAAPKGGKLVASASELVIAKNANALPNDFTFDQKLPNTNNFQSSISTEFLAQGFNDIDLVKVSKLTVNDAMHLNPNGKLALSRDLDGNTIQINADVIAPSSDIALAARTTTIADGVKISTAGSFTNDKPDVVGALSKPASVNGGSINANLLTLGKNVTLDASAGAWVDSKGVLKEGDAGNIKFNTLSTIDDSVTLQAYGFKQGGTLSVSYGLSGSNEKILNIAGNSDLSLTDIDIASSFFNKGGFSKYALSAQDVNIGNIAGVPQEIYATSQTLRLNSNSANEMGGQSILSVATPLVQPDVTRKPVSLSFSADKLGGVLTLAENTTIRTDIAGSVSLAAGKQVNVLGDIVAPSGTINININDKDVGRNNAFDPTQAIFIGEKATLSATGSSIALPDSQLGLIRTQIFNAGNITIDAPKGALIVKEGAVLDVSGTSVVNDTKSVTGFVRETLYGDAGTIKLSASDGLLLDGTFKGAAIVTGRAGTLDLGFSNTLVEAGSPILAGNREFTITQQEQLVAQNFALGDTLKTDAGNAYNDTSTDVINAHISAEQVKQGGFANLKIKSFLGNTSSALKDSIQLGDGLDLKVDGNLKLETPLINVQNSGTAKLSASHITFKSSNSAVDAASIAKGGGKLMTQSKQLYIDGLTAVAGVKETAINTTLDISGQGTQVAQGSIVATPGGIVANGDINLTARQVYPNTASVLGFEAVDGKITINSSGVLAKPVLSAGGILSFKANDIVQNGVITAPFGQINVEAKNSATFTAGSVTSVSANNQIIPFGVTSTGGEVYNPKAGVTTTLLDKSIKIKSDKVDLQKNAVLDLSAGGDMFAYEWVPGIGGSKDILAQPNTYAVIPNLGQDYAPFDQVYSDSSTQTGVGKSVFLTGVPGLATGNYTLLPARYALVPGAFLVEANVTGSKLLPTQTAPQLDGSTLTSGYASDLGTGAHDANWSTFKITDGAIFHPIAGAISKAPSQYILTSATKFFSNPLKTNGQKINLPIDTGKLGLDSVKLTLDSTVVANKQADGGGLQVDISSNNIRVVNTQDASDTTSLQLETSNLNALNAESLLLGGSRKLQNGVLEITTSAKSVTIENSSNNVIKTPEFIATASEHIAVKTGAGINTGSASKAPVKTTMNTNGDGALFVLSSASDISYSRTGGSSASIQGELNIESGSTLKAGNSLVLDSTKLANLAGNVSLQDGGSATFGANRILLGNAPLDVVGLNMNATALTALGQLKALTLNSYNNIDTFGTVNFGNGNLDLTMNAGGIAGHLANGETLTSIGVAPQSNVILAKNFVFKNTQGAVFTTPVDPSGRGLEVNATTVKLDGVETVGGKTEVAGYSKLNINAEEIRVAKAGETNFNVAQTTTLSTGRITAETAANYTIKSNNKLEVAKLAGTTLGAVTGLGATLNLQANDLTVSGNIDVSSGKLGLTATKDLNIVSGATISAKSAPNTFYNKTVNAPAGSVTLTSITGNVNVNTGALVDVTGQAEANAGMVKVQANSGTANIAGDLKGTAGGTGKGGVLDIDVKTLADLTATNAQAAGFSEGRQYRVRTGNVVISGVGTNALNARETSVSADDGNITVTGDIVSTASKNSRIGLYASNGVSLENTANLKANSTKAGEQGGKVDIVTTTGSLDFKVGSRVDTSAGAGGENGKVYLGAARTADNLDINVTNMGTTFIGTRKIDIGGLDSIETDVVNNVNQTTAYDKAETFMKSVVADGAKGLHRLGLVADSRFAIVPVVEFKNTNKNVSNGNLNLKDEFDLHTWRFDPVTGNRVTDEAQLASGKNAEGKMLSAGVLNLRAKGDVLINATLSDGFSSSALGVVTSPEQLEIPGVYDANDQLATPYKPATGVQGLDSWTYNIVAGADFAASNSLTTLKTALVEPSISIIKASKPSIATATVVNTSNSSVRLTSAVTGYQLAMAPIVAIKVTSMPTLANVKAGSSTKLNISNTGEKNLVKSDGSVIKKSDLVVGLTYFIKYDASIGKYKLVDLNTADVVLATRTGIRTGTGDINIAAAGDLIMVNDNSTVLTKRESSAVIYTTGHQAPVLAGFVSPNINNPLYLTNGGDISVITRGNVVGGESQANERQLINHWLFRQGGGSRNLDTTWWVRPDLFKQSLATLGGGNINIIAGGNISNFSASAPTTARFDTNGTTGNQVVDGGGDVNIKADMDIINGVYLVAKGDGNINAGGSIDVTRNPIDNKITTFGTTLALQDGTFNVNAGKNAYIETTFNPTLIPQSAANGGQTDKAYFNTYSPQAEVNITSLNGNAVFGGGSRILSNFSGLDSSVADSLSYSPGRVNVVSNNGNVTIGNTTLLPSSTGSLKILAANNVNLANITMSDADSALLPRVDKPISKFGDFITFMAKQLKTHAVQLLHKDDTEPVLVVAKNGSISASADSIVSLTKAAKLVAATDINGLKLDIQNNNSSDISLVKAGNDVKTKNITVSGAGELLVQAGRNIDLVNPLVTTITTTGNSGDSNPVFNKAGNAALPVDSASITLQAGVGKGANVQGYIDQYILPTGAGPVAIAGDASKLAEYRTSTALAVTDFMRKTTGNNALSDAEALTKFNALNLEAKTIFANRHLTSELIASAKGFAKEGNHNRGNAAISTLFPTLNQGDILLFNSKVSTNSGGSVDLLAPGGAINVGVPGQGGDIGIITEKGGAIRAIAYKDFQVNQSKVITQFGSDIAIWSTNGTIDAGRGSKTATSIPERIVLTDADGNTTIEVKGVAAGSGIRAQSYDPDGPGGSKIAPKKGSVYLTAPKVDAGEAGIEAGDLLIVAPIVLNASNIQVSGASSGVPVAATSSLAGVSAGLSPDSVNSATAAVAQSVAQSANQPFVKPTLPSIISVDVISIGK